MAPRSHHAFAIIAALFGLYGVGAGAVAAHAIPDPQAAARVSTAALYALIHAAVLLGWQGKGGLGIAIKALFTVGMLLFSGALTLTYAFGIAQAARLAPAGGTMLLLAWAALAVVSAQQFYAAPK